MFSWAGCYRVGSGLGRTAHAYASTEPQAWQVSAIATEYIAGSSWFSVLHIYAAALTHSARG